MKHMFRKSLSLVAASVMMVSLIGCGSNSSSSSSSASSSDNTTAETEENTGEKKSLFFVGAMSGGVCWGPCEKGFKQACEDLGYEATWITPTTDSNTAEMVTLCESAITQGADVLIVNPYEDEPFHDVFQNAQDKGIPVISVAGKVDGYTTAFLGTEPVAYGEAQAEALYELMGDKSEEINLVYMQSLLTSVSQNESYDACIKKLDELGVNVNLSLHEECQSSSSTAADRLSALKKTYPEINAIIMSDGYGAEGCGAFIQDGSYQDEIYAIGCDDTEPTLTYLKNGYLNCSIIQNFYDMGYQAVMLGTAADNGEEVAAETDTGTYILTAEGVDAHAADLGFDLN